MEVPFYFIFFAVLILYWIIYDAVSRGTLKALLKHDEIVAKKETDETTNTLN